MADPPPPSYDDAITGDYSSPPKPSSSPPPQPFTPFPPHSSPSNRESTSPPTSENTVYTPTRLPSASPRSQERQRLPQFQVDADEPSSGSGSKKSTSIKIAFILIFCIVIGAVVLWYVLSPKIDEEDTQQSGPDKIFFCQDLLQLPEVSEPTTCVINSFGSYDVGTHCNYQCLGNNSLFGFNQSTDFFRTSGWTELKSSSFTATCDGDSKWEVKVSNRFKEIICGEDSSTCRSHAPKLQCLPPPNPLNCRNHPPNISNATWSRCMRNVYGTYLEGQTCSFKCKSDYVLSSSRGPLDGATHYETSGVYKCSQEKWVNQDGSNKTLQCLTLTDFIIQDIG